MIQRAPKECADALKVDAGINSAANFVRSGFANRAERR
jgi:hypothetical protein